MMTTRMPKLIDLPGGPAGSAAEATSRFLQRVLFSARPGFEQPDEQAAFVRSVDRARDGLKTDLLDRPETRSELLDMIGLIYLESRRFEEALPLLKEAYELRSELYGGADLRTLRSGEQLAAVLRRLKRYGEAIELGETIVRLARSGDVPRALPIERNARTTLSEALLYRDAPGDFARLREIGREALQVMEAADSTEAEIHQAAYQSFNYATGLVARPGEPSEEDERDLQRVVNASARWLEGRPMDEGLDTMRLYHLHAQLLGRMGRWYDSLLIYNELVPLMKPKFPADDSLLLQAWTRHLQLRAIYETRDAKPEEVEALLGELRELVASTRDSGVAYGRVLLQLVLWNAGQYEEVHGVIRQTIALGPDKPHVPRGAYQQAMAMRAELQERRPDLLERAPGDE